MSINDIPLGRLKEILASDMPLTIVTTEALITRLEQVEAAIERVREEHSERVLKYPGGAEEHYCAYDQDSAWPCDTIRALDGEQS